MRLRVTAYAHTDSVTYDVSLLVKGNWVAVAEAMMWEEGNESVTRRQLRAYEDTLPAFRKVAGLAHNTCKLAVNNKRTVRRDIDV
jgi:hypothetical protein